MFGPKMCVEYKTKEGEVMKLTLCPPKDEKEAVKKFVEWMNDNRVRQYLGQWSGITESSEAEWFRNQAISKEQINWCIYAGETLIGGIDIHEIDLKHRQAELGIILGDKKFWDKGIATSVEIAALDYGLNNIVAGGLNKVSALVYEGNIASQKALEKAGLRTVGTLKDHIWKNGRWYDSWLGEITRKEWDEKREAVLKTARITKLDLYPGIEVLPE